MAAARAFHTLKQRPMHEVSLDGMLMDLGALYDQCCRKKIGGPDAWILYPPGRFTTLRYGYGQQGNNDIRNKSLQ